MAIYRLFVMRKISELSGSGAGGDPVRSAAVFGEWVSELGELEPGSFDEGSALEAITAIEKVKRAAAAAQARLSVHVEEQARERQRLAGTSARKLGIGVGAQIALARLESPHRGARHLALATVLTRELPHTLRGMTDGLVSEWQATLVARETACLDADTRREIDARIADRLGGWGDLQTEREVRKLAYAAEPGAAVKRCAQAEADRHVGIRPAPDTMCYLTALLPVAQGVAAYAALMRAADQGRAAGDERGKGQIMADTMVERLTGQASAPDLPVEVEVMMPLDTLFGAGHTPAHLSGYGAIPAALARRLVRDTKASVWVRRLFADPSSGRLVAMDSRRRRFDGELRHFVVLRDQFCRTPWCDAPIRQADHAIPHRDDGSTDEANAQGLCEACNYAKEAPGWHARPTGTTVGHLVTVTTPTGHRYTSSAPDPPVPWRR